MLLGMSRLIGSFSNDRMRVKKRNEIKKMLRCSTWPRGFLSSVGRSAPRPRRRPAHRPTPGAARSLVDRVGLKASGCQKDLPDPILGKRPGEMFEYWD